MFSVSHEKCPYLFSNLNVKWSAQGVASPLGMHIDFQKVETPQVGAPQPLLSHAIVPLCRATNSNARINTGSIDFYTTRSVYIHYFIVTGANKNHG